MCKVPTGKPGRASSPFTSGSRGAISASDLRPRTQLLYDVYEVPERGPGWDPRGFYGAPPSRTHLILASLPKNQDVAVALGWEKSVLAPEPKIWVCITRGHRALSGPQALMWNEGAGPEDLKAAMFSSGA